MPARDQTPRSIDTIAVHGGEPEDYAYHSVTMPIVCTATYSFKSTHEIHEYFQGRKFRDEYGRYGNPTIRLAEGKLAALENAESAVLFPSGMGAITTMLLAMLKSGDHVVMTSDAYRRTHQFIQTTLCNFGIEHTFVAPDDEVALAAALRPGITKLIITEAPTNPYLRVMDIKRAASIKRDCPGCLLLVDATLGTPANLRPLELGADLVLHSCSKYLGGHNDLLAGAICGERQLIENLRSARGLFGGIPDPHSAYLLIRGMKTLGVRMRQHNESGMRIARYLESHPHVERVFYPGLESHPDHAVARRSFCGNGYGGLISFRVRADLDATSRVIDAMTVPSIGPSLGGAESLIEQPALMSFYELTTEQRAKVGIGENLVRLAVGLESADDLIEDLANALRTLDMSERNTNDTSTFNTSQYQ